MTLCRLILESRRLFWFSQFNNAVKVRWKSLLQIHRDFPKESVSEKNVNMTLRRCWDRATCKRLNAAKVQNSTFFSTRCNIYISRLCYNVSVRLSVRLSVTEVHWRIIANLGFKFRSHFTAHCGRRAACRRRAACVWIISRHASQC